MHCNDKAKDDSTDAGSKELQVKQPLDDCVTKGVDGHRHLIQTMSKARKYFGMSKKGGAAGYLADYKTVVKRQIWKHLVFIEKNAVKA
ncbi:hypothetical protein P7K49_038311 [Saguinus oedipus]|uniref:Uncharacterized protein n=1 Tax=Saguinus oedipus TaxID=9490 RepID=A0ABQ9TEC5_SAGOE|nr:hypothetical protein P7K49_038311 [Saguinus oedipus]